MNFFEKIKLKNFRNFKEFNIDFCNECNVIVGANGTGKTNILESLSLFEKGRGFRKDIYKNMINKKNLNQMFCVKSKFITKNNNLDLELTCDSLDNKLKKKILVNGSNTKESLNYFDELYSIIYFLPEMERFFIGSPSLRRNFFDRLVYGVDKKYLLILNNYKKKIIERNAILKTNNYDVDWIKQIENEIVDYAIKIYFIRNQHLNNLNNEVDSFQEVNLNSNKLKLNIIDNFIKGFDRNIYDIKPKYLLELKNLRKYDSIVGGCKIGPHKSDIQGFSISKNIDLFSCSTGQQKAAVLLIIIAQGKFLLKNLNRQPIILLDEVCSHLDHYNRDILLELINSIRTQTFLTGTEKNFFSFLSTKASYYYIN